MLKKTRIYYLLTKIGADTAENEPTFAKNLTKKMAKKTTHARSAQGRVAELLRGEVGRGRRSQDEPVPGLFVWTLLRRPSMRTVACRIAGERAAQSHLVFERDPRPFTCAVYFKHSRLDGKGTSFFQSINLPPCVFHASLQNVSNTLLEILGKILQDTQTFGN